MASLLSPEITARSAPTARGAAMDGVRRCGSFRQFGRSDDVPCFPRSVLLARSTPRRRRLSICVHLSERFRARAPPALIPFNLPTGKWSRRLNPTCNKLHVDPDLQYLCCLSARRSDRNATLQWDQNDIVATHPDGHGGWPPCFEPSGDLRPVHWSRYESLTRGPTADPGPLKSP